MTFFDPGNRRKTEQHKRIYAAYELAFTFIEFAAGLLFLVGSFMFFYKSLENAAIWCFVVGSACFVVGPGLKLAREVHYAAIGDVNDLAERAGP
ncbi:YrhK family protein [Oricola cellulosilytica]|uniref:YrhK domain-containing protein n=1 Tax=Oricola cellulosilytica TaxID=1429082 RepID=A0A4R0PBY0_9HYPH|nr:YrhK family protein [Oricola cellulosilytica]TCD14972.1 hypothetical protein E0D97_05310 [Oricola cellulosilytica]